MRPSVGRVPDEKNCLNSGKFRGQYTNYPRTCRQLILICPEDFAGRALSPGNKYILSPKFYIPHSEILSDDVKVFHELIKSDLFERYASSQELLESSDEDEQSVLRSIVADAKALRFRFSRLLDAKRILLSLLPITASLIDTVYGKFPGSLAKIFGDALTQALKSRQRITIYNYGDTHMALLKEHYRAKQRNKTE